MGNTLENVFLADYLKTHPYLLTSGNSDDVEDLPSFTVDQRALPLQMPPYTDALPVNSALLG